MIVFINGAFGVGKTTVANHLSKELPNCLLYDPEEVGLMLRNIVKPVDASDDFQDYPMWPSLVVEVAKMLKRNYNQNLIVPMTIWREAYFNEIIPGLRTIDANTHHFCLTASAKTIHERICKRGEQQEGDWIFNQIEKCINAFHSPIFEERIDTSGVSVEEIVRHILSRISTKAV